MKKIASVLLAALLTSGATFAESAKKSIVVYFSWGGTTESVAKEIASQTGSDIWRIEEAAPYTRDYNKVLDVAQNEKRKNARPRLRERSPSFRSTMLFTSAGRAGGAPLR